MSSVHQRDPSVARGRVGQSAAGAAKATLTSLAQRALSPNSYSHSHDNLASLVSPPPSSSSIRPGQVSGSHANQQAQSPLPTPLERKTSVSYGHHRQTSVVPTARTHSRQNSSVQSPSMASLKSPPMAGVSELGFSALPVDTFEFRSPQANSTATFQPFGTQSFSSNSTVTNNDAHSMYAPSGQDSISSTMRTMRPAPVRSESTSTMSRKKSVKPRSHGRSDSHDTEEKTVGEYALQHLFKAFSRKADTKIDLCVAKIPHEILTVDEICGVGVDAEFDALVQALGHISQHKPKLLVDIAMLWRGLKAQDLQEAQSKWRNIKSSPEARQQAMAEIGDAGQLFATYYERVERAEKRVIIAIYLICRLLMQVYIQCDLRQITDYLDNKIEDLMFEQLTRLDPDKVASSSLHRSNWIIYSQLLGLMSFRNFANVNRRFLKLLQQVQEEVGPKGAVVAANSAIKVELVIRAMTYICIRTHPDSDWQQSIEYLLHVAKLFSISHGKIVKTAYCSVLETLLLPTVVSSGQQLSNPRWREVINVLNNRVTQLAQKPRYWEDAFPVQTMLLCVSPNEIFTSQWTSFINGLQAKLKDRTTRGPALQSICRLVWTYLHRSTDPAASMRKLEDVVRIVLPTGKKSALATDPMFAAATVEFVRLIGYRFPEWSFKTIVFPLLNADLFTSGREVRAEQLEPERTVIGIRAFLAIISDLEDANSSTAQAPKFPSFQRKAMGFDAIPRIKAQSNVNEASTETDRRGQAIRVNTLSDSVRSYYNTFCDILGKITLICDNAFGSQAALDEKFGATPNASTPKTPLTESFTFGRRDDHLAQHEFRQGFYDLLQVAVQVLPKFMSSQIPFNPLINLLCTGTAHVNSTIAQSSGDSLKAIARQNHAQQVTVGFARFIFNFDARYSTTSEEGLLGSGHIENTLRLYLELLQIWVDEIKQKTAEARASTSGDSSQRANLPLEVTSVGPLVDEIESHGIFFLCSQGRRVRRFAVQVLRIITEFDKALNIDDNSRVISILDGDLLDVISPDDNRLTVAERSRLQKGKKRSGSQNGLIELCSSDVSYDTMLWIKVFPNIIHQAFERCPLAIALSREIVCARLLQMRHTINGMEDMSKANQAQNMDRGPIRYGSIHEAFIEQWKMYLVMACTTMQNAGAQTQSQLSHVRNKSRLPQSGENFNSARSLFAYMIPLLGATSSTIRNGVVNAMGNINKLMYRTLLESLQYAVTSVNDEAKFRVGSAHQRAGSSPRSRKHDDMRTETAHVYKLTSKFLHDDEILRDEWIVNNLLRYTDDMRIFLSDSEVQNDWYFQSLRQYYCGLVEEVFEGVNRTKDPSRWMSFDSRKAAFTLIEDWCGYSPNQSQITAREDSMRAKYLNTHPDSSFTASIEIEKRKLKTAALSAMASLCAGPISIQLERSTVSFDAKRLLEWIDQILSDPSDKMHTIGRRAMQNLIKHNERYPLLLERVIDRCVAIGAEKPKAMESYFDVVYDVLFEKEDYPLHLWRTLGMLVISLGYENSTIRVKAARLLRILEERHYPERTSKLQDFDISVSDRTTAVYKLAQFEISKRLSKTHSEITFLVFSQFCLQYKTLKGDHQRNLIAAMLPWVQVLELEVDQSGVPTQKTYMVLVNLVEITTKSSTSLHNETQALWQALATGPHAGNVQLILNFTITLCMERREQSFVDYARQIVVFLSSTPAGQKVIEYLLLQITPRNMVHTEKPMQQMPTNTANFPYVAEISDALPIGGRQSGFSLGQLSLILLVDLMVAPVKLAAENVPLLIQICIVLWDHHIPLVQEQAREMLVHLIHELVISKYDNLGSALNAAKQKDIEEFVESIRQSKPEVVWNYADNDAEVDESEGMRVPAAMQFVTKQIIDIFSLTYPGIHDQWAKTSLSWATSCSVRHLACRSFQIFRCVFSNLDASSLADILARLSNTVADETPEVQGFAMEILCTLKKVIGNCEARELLKFPQLFYVTCACLSTVNEREFVEVLHMLDALLSKFNLSDPAVLKILTEAMPTWSGDFEGLLPNIYKGLKSASAMPLTLKIIIKTASLPAHHMIGKGSRYPFAVLAHLPSFLHYMELRSGETTVQDHARILASAAENDGNLEIGQCLNGFANGHYSENKEFLVPLVSALARSYFPEYQVQCLIFLMGILSNKTPWCKLKTLEILQVLVPEIDMRSPEMISYGSDLISPLLRLLQTEYCTPALELMDVIMKRNMNTLEPQNVRMSMVLSGTNNVKAKKEFERTKSLYGIPEDSGWSIPMPASHAKTTRENVHNVFYTCAALNSAEEVPQATPDIEFDQDEYQEQQYFGLQRSDTTISEEMPSEEIEQRPEVDYESTDLIQKLDSLDDFFDDLDGGDYGMDYADFQHSAHSSGDAAAARSQAWHLNSVYFDARESVMSDNRSSGATIRPSNHVRSVTSPSQTSTHMRDASNSSTLSTKSTMQSVHEFLSESDDDSDGNKPSANTVLSPASAGVRVFEANGMTPVLAPGGDNRNLNGATSPYGIPGSGLSSPNTGLNSTMIRTYSGMTGGVSGGHAPSKSGPAVPYADPSPTSQSVPLPYGMAAVKRAKSHRSGPLKDTREKEGNALRGTVTRTRSRSTALKSPEVPKVPEAFLQDMRSPEL